MNHLYLTIQKKLSESFLNMHSIVFFLFWCEKSHPVSFCLVTSLLWDWWQQNSEATVLLSVFCFITESCETLLSCRLNLESFFKDMQKQGKDERYTGLEKERECKADSALGLLVGIYSGYFFMRNTEGPCCWGSKLIRYANTPLIWFPQWHNGKLMTRNRGPFPSRLNWNVPFPLWPK